MPSRIPMLLLPGMDGTGRMFAPLIARLPASIEARPVAYPGDEALGYAELTEFVERLLPRDRDHFVLAESFSGPLGLAIAAQRPPGLRGLILAATFASSPLAWLPGWSHGLARPWMFGGLGFGPRFALGLGRCPPEVTPLLRDALASVSPAVLASRAREILRCRAPGGDVLVPVLVLAARHDRLLARRDVERLQRLLPQAQVEWFDAPHLLLQACPDEVAATITAWVERQR